MRGNCGSKMTFSEIKGDLLSAPRGWVLVHCISADYALGAGVAKQIDNQYNMKEMLRSMYGEYDFDSYGPGALLVLDVINLVTKDRCFEKPTFESLGHALLDLRKFIEMNGITRLAMPRIGCGLDRLNWDDVRELILETFKDTRVDIVVYTL